MKVVCILGNHLFDPQLLPHAPQKGMTIFMREDHELCTHFRYHKHKIVFFLSAMRKYSEELRAAGYQVHYEKLGEYKDSYESRLLAFLKKSKCEHFDFFEIEDKFFEKKIVHLCVAHGFQYKVHPNPMFLTTRAQFSSMIGKNKKPFMKTFYESQRKRLKILVESDGSPVGGKWSFDDENRKSLPKGHRAPTIPSYEPDSIDQEVISVVEREFPDHPGDASQFWLPTDRKGARSWAKDFFLNRFENFGPYEDAISQDQPFLYHSVLTPFLNTGLITPKECVSAALRNYQQKKVPLNSCEGFVRQIIGWREFVRGIYQNYSEVQDTHNHFGHKMLLTKAWYTGESGIPPLDDVIRKTLRYSYAHHIERLMVVGSMMLLLEVDPREGHKWFMEMFIDSSDWVMGPNVYGMALYSDGGIFTTKPYVCGSNYYKKMSGYRAGDWCDKVDGLYWSFIRKHKNFSGRNPRMSMMVRALEKIPAKRMETLDQEAKKLREILVQAPR